MKGESPQKKKPALSTMLFVFGATCLALAGWELATGRTFAFGGSLGRRNRPASEEQSYATLFVGGAILAAACFARAKESR